MWLREFGKFNLISFDARAKRLQYCICYVISKSKEDITHVSSLLCGIMQTHVKVTFLGNTKY